MAAHVGVCRGSSKAVHTWFADWDLHIASGGVLTHWDGGFLDWGQNNVWMRVNHDSPWVIDLTIGAGHSSQWIYRRDHTIRRNWDDAVLFTSENVPYLAPELQLLFKSKDPRSKDDLDACTVVPLLTKVQRRILEENLEPGHRWRSLPAGA